jgi:hypothetical protein
VLNNGEWFVGVDLETAAASAISLEMEPLLDSSSSRSEIADRRDVENFMWEL